MFTHIDHHSDLIVKCPLVRTDHTDHANHAVEAWQLFNYHVLYVGIEACYGLAFDL